MGTAKGSQMQGPVHREWPSLFASAATKQVVPWRPALAGLAGLPARQGHYPFMQSFPERSACIWRHRRQGTSKNRLHQPIAAMRAGSGHPFPSRAQAELASGMASRPFRRSLLSDPRGADRDARSALLRVQDTDGLHHPVGRELTGTHLVRSSECRPWMACIRLSC